MCIRDSEDVLREEQLIRGGRSHARNHAEVVRVRYDPKQLDLMTLLATFWAVSYTHLDVYKRQPHHIGGQLADVLEVDGELGATGRHGDRVGVVLHLSLIHI